jgi:hypothetical protein
LSANDRGVPESTFLENSCPFNVGEELSPLYKELHDVADLAYREIVKCQVPGTHVA